MYEIIIASLYAKCQPFTFDNNLTCQSSSLPFLGIANKTMPRARIRLLEHEHIVVGLSWFEAKDLNECSLLSFGSCLAKMQTGLNNTRIIHHQQ